MNQGIPTIPYKLDITELFRNFYHNWDTLSPVLWLLFGTLTAFSILGMLKKLYQND